MTWNAPTNGDWSTVDVTKPPYTEGIMILSHDEVLFVIETIKPFEEQFGSDVNSVVGGYNVSTNYEKAINGDTYNAIKGYDPAINTLGINENGIIYPDPIDEPPIDETPTEETPTEGV